MARRKVLPSKNTVQDIEAVTRSVFPKASNSTIQRIVGYVVISKRDLSALGDIAREIRFLINPDDATSVDLTKTRIEFDQVEAVIDSNLIPSDSAFAQDLGAVLQKQGRKPRSVRGAVRSLPHLDDEQDGCSDDSDSRNVHCKAPAIAVPGKGNAPVETLGAPETRSIIPDLGQRRRADELLSPDISSGCGSKIQQKTAALK